MEDEAEQQGEEDEPGFAGVVHREGEEAPGGGEDDADRVRRLPSDPVAEGADHRHEQGVDRMRPEQEAEDLAGLDADGDREVGDRERHHEVVVDVLHEPQAHGGEDLARVALEHGLDAVVDALFDLLGLDLLEDRGIGDAGADVVADEDDDRREPERDPPAPREEGLFGQGRGEDEEDTGGEQVAQRHTRLRPRGPEAAFLVR